MSNLKEVDLKLLIKYEGCSAEDVIEVETKDGLAACEEIMERNRERMRLLKEKNVYDSRIIKRCRLCDLEEKI